MISLANALSSNSELSDLDFKRSFDVNSKGDWCEIIKDFVAMANSGGGRIFIGVLDNGSPAGTQVTPVLNLDPADIINKIFTYTGQHFGDLKIERASKDGHDIAAITIYGSSTPIVFTKPGNYPGPNGRTKNAFRVGSVYFRHGAKSEPCTSQDLRKFLKREIDKVKDSWLKGIRKVVEAPKGAKIVTVPATSESTGLKVVNDPNAPAVTLTEEDFQDTYPYTYRELSQILRERYTDFLQNQEYHRIRKELEENPMYCKERKLNPNNPKTSSQKFYSRAIISAFDNYYTKKN